MKTILLMIAVSIAIMGCTDPTQTKNVVIDAGIVAIPKPTVNTIPSSVQDVVNNPPMSSQEKRLAIESLKKLLIDSFDTIKKYEQVGRSRHSQVEMDTNCPHYLSSDKDKLEDIRNKLISIPWDSIGEFADSETYHKISNYISFSIGPTNFCIVCSRDIKYDKFCDDVEEVWLKDIAASVTKLKNSSVKRKPATPSVQLPPETQMPHGHGGSE